MERTTWRNGLIGLGLFWFVACVAAQTVELEVRPGLTATAEFRNPQGTGMPVLILHGFLQTRDFPTVRRLAEALADEGHPVLTPTLSLGVPARSQSLKCEAIHLHTLEEDARELGLWVEWLAQRTGRSVTLIGHSAGGAVISRYLALSPSPAVREAILISIAAPTGHPPKAGEPESEQALGEYAMAYCDRYPTTAKAFHSYADWDGPRIIDAILASEVPVHLVLGGADSRISADWIALLRAKGADLHIIEGANHFFDDAREFELNDTILEILATGQ